MFGRAHAVDPAFARDGPVGRGGDEEGGHGGVVLKDLSLGGPGFRVNDFAQVGEGKFVAFHGHPLLLLACHLFSSAVLCC
ncbi:hypothetical protein PJL18_01177 [Paenarthrobacter nicotinovorans]|nr:hypothetical protein [Paenarthrobacter nicotinovorans]